MKLHIVRAAVPLIVLAACFGYWLSLRGSSTRGGRNEFTGSAGCRDCHQGFYEKWAGSFHGLAMRPYTSGFAGRHLQPQHEGLEIRGRTYRYDMPRGAVLERGPQGEKAYPIAHALGGKNVFYFLTAMPGGRLQVLPLAYDVRLAEWYDTTGSMIRHLRESQDEALDWTARQLTFNTSCYTCHVSQLRKNYSLETDSYATTWGEPGINCEACHGPGLKHAELARAAGDGKLENIEIISTRKFTKQQMNWLCAPCHAKMYPLDAEVRPGAPFFDNYGLAALEDPDFYPDGRDLGENFTYTLWLLSPCVQSGRLDCMHCHTSSGRYKFPGAETDKACLPCHSEHVANPAAHSHHAAASEGSRCVACHMPETSFARMRRHDHSMLPPVPAATLRFGSPNACNLCHKDKNARWSDAYVRKWYRRDYQKLLVERAALVDAARKQDWSRLGDMTAYVGKPGNNEVFSASLLRLLERCPDPAKWPAYYKALGDPSPLVRSSAAAGMASNGGPEALRALARAAGDPSRLVRIQAAAALSRQPPDALQGPELAAVQNAWAEYEESLRSRPDDSRSHYNLGNFFHDRGDLAAARGAYETAVRLQPSLVPALVNLSLASARLGDAVRAESALRQAITHEPSSAEAHHNLGLLLAEQGKLEEAESHFRAALKADPQLPDAAYNLAVLLADRRPAESLELCRRAAELRPDSGKYAYTLAFYLWRQGKAGEAAGILERLLRAAPGDPDAMALLGAIRKGPRR